MNDNKTKFKTGYWITNLEDGENFQIINIANDKYEIKKAGIGASYIFSLDFIEKNFRLQDK